MRQPRPFTRFSVAVLAIVAVLLASWAAIAWFDWLPRLTPRQQQALDWVRSRPPEPPGSSAITRLWLSGHALSAAERERLSALPPEQLLAELAAAPRRTLHAPMRNADPEQALVQALANPEGLATAVAAAQPLLDQLDWLRAAGHARDPLTLHALHGGAPAAPVNIGLPAFAVRQAAAAELAQGRPRQALEMLCIDAAFWRSVTAGTDTLIARMVAAAMLRDNALLANAIDRRAQVPWPAACDLAYAPLPAQAHDFCEVMRSEIGSGLRGTPAWTPPDEGIAQRLFAHATHGDALSAEALAGDCPTGGSARLDPPPVVSCSILQHAFDFAGCTLAAIRVPAYRDYARRVHDIDATLRAVRLAAWLRRQPDPTAAAFRSRPPALSQPGQRIVGSGDAIALQFPLQAPRGPAHRDRVAVVRYAQPATD